MHLSDCETPVRVYNKYLGEYVWTRCGHCNSCRKYRSSRWISRLEVERSYHQYSAFITLTYNDQALPRLELLPYGLNYPPKMALRGVFDSRYSDVCIPLSQLSFLTALDKEYFDKRIELEGSIPFANFRDIQLYHKRLNKKIHDKVTKRYNNFRFFTVSEYGSTSHRPHFHEILFFDDPEIARALPKLVHDSWCYKPSFGSSSSLGFVYIEFVEKSANSYVAQYLNQLFDLPSFYSHSELRPRFVCSKRPFIGAGDYDSESMQQIFDSESPSLCVRDPASGKLKDVPLLPCVKNRLFPRIAYFEQIYHSLRVELYGSAFAQGFLCRSFEAFCKFVYSGYRKTSEVSRQAYEYMIRYDHSCGKVPHAFLRRVYYISKRVLLTCKNLGLTVDEYVCKIERFYSNCKISALKEFYSFQEEYSKTHLVESLVHCYPEFAYQNQDCDFIPLDRTRDYINMVQDNMIHVKKCTKSHYKNAYIEAKSETCEFFVFLISYYAQKCNENLQAFSRYCSERLGSVT